MPRRQEREVREEGTCHAKVHVYCTESEEEASSAAEEASKAEELLRLTLRGTFCCRATSAQFSYSAVAVT